MRIGFFRDAIISYIVLATSPSILAPKAHHFIPSTTSPTVAHFCRSNDLSSSNFIVCGSLEYRNAGILECWVKSITPLLHHSNTLSHLLDRVPAPRNHQANFSLLSFRELGQAFFQPLFKTS